MRKWIGAVVATAALTAAGLGGSTTASPAAPAGAPEPALPHADLRDPAPLAAAGLVDQAPTDPFAPAAPAALTTSAATGGTQFAGVNGMYPVRVLDTRATHPVGPGETVGVAIRGVAGIPADADAVLLNVTAVGSSVGGYVTVWPSDAARPTASNLNMTPGQTVPNLVVSRIGADGRVLLFNAFGTVDLVADAVGWTRADQHLRGVTPTRILDTRSGLGLPGALGPAAVGDLTVAGVAGLPPTGVGVAVLNVTATNPTTGGYLTVWPSGSARPNASNLNFVAGQTVPNLVFASVGANGKVSMFNASGSTDVVADLVGWMPAGAAYLPMNPVRVMDTRTHLGTYGVASPAGLLSFAGRISTSQVDLDLRSAYPAWGNVGAYVLNVTVIDPSAGGYLTVWPAGTDQPVVSNLNFVPGQTVPNLVVVKPGDLGRVSLVNFSGQTHLAVDLVGIVPKQNGLDLPDDTGGAKYHVVYVQAADDDPDGSGNPAIAVPQIRSEVAALDGWLANETGQHLNIDRANGQVDVTVWRLPGYTRAVCDDGGGASARPLPCLRRWIDQIDPVAGYWPFLVQLAEDGFGQYTSRRWLVYVDGDRNGVDGLCGVTVGQWTTVYRKSACGTINGTTTAQGVGTSVNSAAVALHEMLHGLGAVSRCAPHYGDNGGNNPGHVNDTADLMYWFANIYGDGKHIDPGHDDYWTGQGDRSCVIGGQTVAWPDVSKSPFVAQP